MIRFLEESSEYGAPAGLRGVRAKARIVVGGKEGRRMLRSGERLAALLPDARVTVLPGLYHGEFSLKRPEEYVQALEELMA